VEAKKPGGLVFLAFSTVEGAAAAAANLNGRFFAGRTVTAEYLPAATYAAATGFQSIWRDWSLLVHPRVHPSIAIDPSIDLKSYPRGTQTHWFFYFIWFDFALTTLDGVFLVYLYLAICIFLI
jgi:hypothetical protein